MFVIYTEVDGTGHVGVSVNGNNYDFGRFAGKYTDATVAGPNVLIKSTGAPGSSRRQSFKRHEFDVCEEVNNAIAKVLDDDVGKGEEDFPKSVKDRLGWTESKTLAQVAGVRGGTGRYMNSDWGLFGMTCKVYTVDAIMRGLKVAIDSGKLDKCCEDTAREAMKKMHSLEVFTSSPASLNYELSRFPFASSCSHIDPDPPYPSSPNTGTIHDTSSGSVISTTLGSS